MCMGLCPMRHLGILQISPIEVRNATAGGNTGAKSPRDASAWIVTWRGGQ